MRSCFNSSRDIIATSIAVVKWVVCGVIKTCAVIKMCILHAELPGTLVYHRGERLVAACEQLAPSRASVVRPGNEKLYPASVTKIMTLLLVTEALDSGKISLSDTVTASASAASKRRLRRYGSKEGEQMNGHDLLKATAGLQCGAARWQGAAARRQRRAFTAMINERAGQLGMKNTHFDNCTGLDDTTTTHFDHAIGLSNNVTRS